MLLVDRLRQPVQLMFVTKRKSAYKERHHFHPFVELYYVHEGVGQIIVDQRVYEAAPGTLLYYRPFQPHYQQLLISEATPYIRSQFQYDPAYLSAFLQLFPELNRFHDRLLHAHGLLHVQQGPRMAELDHYIRDTQAVFDADPEHDSLERRTLFLLSLLQRMQPLWQEGEQGEETVASSSPLVVRVLEWIDAHYGEPFELEALAAAVHLSPKYLSGLFRKTTGKTITEFLTVRRLKQAAQLLQTTELTVQEISARVGYANCAHFCQMFKQHMALTPSQFRSRPLVPQAEATE